MRRNKTEKKNTQTHNNKPPILQCSVPSSDNCNGNENTKPADILYILIRAHRYANFVLILISFQDTDYKIDNYNISNTANQRREKTVISKHLTRQSIDKHWKKKWTLWMKNCKSAHKKMSDWFWKTICKKWVTGMTIISTKWHLTKILIEIWMVHGERKNFARLYQGRIFLF